MARSHRGTRVSRPAPRTNVWIGSRFNNVSVAANGIVLIATLTADALALRPFTIVRTRMELMVTSDQLSASEFVQGSFGILVVTDSATAAGAASIPSPGTEPEADYFVYQPFITSFLLATGVGFSEQSGSAPSYTIDSKSMRKVGIDDDAAMMVENEAAVGMNIAGEGRMLIKLH